MHESMGRVRATCALFLPSFLLACGVAGSAPSASNVDPAPPVETVAATTASGTTASGTTAAGTTAAGTTAAGTTSTTAASSSPLTLDAESAVELGAVSSRASASTTPARVAGEPIATSLAIALDTILPENVRADIFFIASDELGGRDTPSEGLKIAARFLRARLERLGWKPGASDGYFYRYQLEQKRLDEKASVLEFQSGGKTRTLSYGQDYFLHNSRELFEAVNEATIVACGSGTKDEFKAAKPEGKWALCFDTDAEISDLARRARDAKALGLIVGPGPEYKGEPYARRFSAQLESQRRGRASFPDKKKEASEDGGKRRVEIPTVCLSKEGLDVLVAAANLPNALAVGADVGLAVKETRKFAGQGGLIDVENVCGFWPGSDPELSKEVIIVSAHYDHIGTQNGIVNNGADDNGSGTCGLLALAEALRAHGPLRRSVMLIWVSGEEKGLWGSRAWSDAPWLPEGCKAIADINIDMIGRNAPDKLLITPTSEREKDYNGIVRIFERLAPLEGFPKLGNADEFYTRSDHAMFARLGIPVAFLFSDTHEDYHRPGDDPEKIDNDKIRRVTRLVLRALAEMQTDVVELR